jgi:hypothetical protein
MLDMRSFVCLFEVVILELYCSNGWDKGVWNNLFSLHCCLSIKENIILEIFSSPAGSFTSSHNHITNSFNIKSSVENEGE